MQRVLWLWQGKLDTKPLIKPCEIQSGSYILYFPWKKSDKNFKPNMKQFPPLNMFFSYLSVCVEFEFWVESPWVLTRHSRNERANNFQSISVLFSSVHSMSFIDFFVLKLNDQNKDLIKGKLISKCLFWENWR